MRNKTLLFMAALTATLAASAGEWAQPAYTGSFQPLTAGDTIYIYNTEAQLFLTEGNDYGTHASVGLRGLRFVVNPYVPENGGWDGKTYNIFDESVTKGGWKKMFITDEGHVYVDLGNQEDYLWEFVDLGGNTYQIKGAALNPTWNGSGYMEQYRLGRYTEYVNSQDHISSGTGVIYVVNAINHKESRENVMRRLKANNLALKNSNSEREITIWAYYKQILVDYKYAYKYEFNVSEKKMDNMFVFPNINARDPKEKVGYQRQANALRELDKVTEKLEMKKLDCQMFRHGCAHFLCDVKHISAEEAHDYFGHQDSEMIREVYAKANARQRRHRVDAALKDLITEKPTKDMAEMIIDI